MPRSPYPNNDQLLHQPTCYMCLFCAPYQMGKEGYVSFTQLNTMTHSLLLPEVWLKCKSLCCPSLYIFLGHKHLLSFHSPKKITASNKTSFVVFVCLVGCFWSEFHTSLTEQQTGSFFVFPANRQMAVASHHLPPFSLCWPGPPQGTLHFKAYHFSYLLPWWD